MSKVVFFSDLVKLLKNPKLGLDNNLQQNSLLSKFWLVLQTVCFGVAVALGLAFFGDWVSTLVGFRSTENNIIVDTLAELSILELVLTVAVVTPLIEELQFRLLLSKNKTSVFVGLYFFLVISFSYIINLANFESRVQTTLLIFNLILWSLAAYLLQARWSKPEEQVNQKEVFYNKFLARFNLIFWLNVIIFGLLHAVNYQSLDTYFLLVPILVLPQLFVGILFSYIRVRLDFYWAWIAHGLYNFVISIPMIIYQFLTLDADIKQFVEASNSLNLSEALESLSSEDQTMIVISFSLLLFSFSIVLAVLLISSLDYLVFRKTKLSKS